LKAERLENLLAFERTRKIQSERGGKELTEEQVQALQSQQTTTLVNLTKELKQSQDESTALRSRIDSLEQHIQNQKDGKREGVLCKLNSSLIGRSPFLKNLINLKH
jgi:hypothetical protein